jgi:outer membrane protein, heavy metal efflux system
MGRLLVIAAMLIPVSAGHALELPAFLSEVAERNPSLLAARGRAAAEGHRVAPAATWEDPFLAIGPDGIPVSGGSPGLVRYQLTETIPFLGKRSARGEAAEARAQSAAADAETVAREVRVVATQAFYEALLNQRAGELNDELRQLVDEATASGRTRYETGTAGHHEWLLAKAELGVLETERVRLDNAGAELRARLNELRDRPPTADVGRLSLPASSADEPSSDDPAATSPELRSLDGVVAAAEASRKVARLAYLPDVVLQGMVEKPRDPMEDEESMWGVMAGVTLPIFWWRKQDELAAAATLERDAALAERRSLENRLRTEASDARREYDTARRVVDLYEKDVVPLTDLALRSARTSYAAGTGSLADLIGTAKARRTQELELLAARTDVELSRLRLREILSAPPTLRLAPSAPTLFGAGMGGAMRAASGASAPTSIRMGRGVGVGAGRGAPSGGGAAPSSSGMPGM